MGGLWGCLSSPEQDGEGGGRHWEWSPVLGVLACSLFQLIGPRCPGADGGRGFNEPQTSPVLMLCWEATDAGAGSQGGL